MGSLQRFPGGSLKQHNFLVAIGAKSLPLGFEPERLRGSAFPSRVLAKLDYLLSRPIVDQYEKARGGAGSFR